MDAQDFRSLQEAYQEVVMNEGLGGAKNQGDYEKMQRKRQEVRDEHLQKYKSGELPYQKQKKADQAQKFLKKYPRKKRNQQEQVDLYDIILSHLLDEGYAETQEAAETIMVNMSEEWREDIIEAEGSYGQTPRATGVKEYKPSNRRPLDEISLKTKIKAYARTQDPDNEMMDDGEDVYDQGDRIRAAIVRKHGEKAGEHADAHGYSSHFGRGTDRAEPRIETNRKYRTNKDTGKMHGQDQSKLKRDLQGRAEKRRVEGAAARFGRQAPENRGIRRWRALLSDQ